MMVQTVLTNVDLILNPNPNPHLITIKKILAVVRENSMGVVMTECQQGLVPKE
jgi:hypothetical protein